jgi:hypothetical protein
MPMSYTLGYLVDIGSDLPFPWPIQLLAAIAAVAWMLYARKLWVYLVDYRITEDALEIVLLRWFVLKRVLFTEIQELSRVSPSDLLRSGELLAIGIGNRLFAPRVRIRRRNGVPIIITPADADGFVAEVARRARASAE